MAYPYMAYWSWWNRYDDTRTPPYYATTPQIYFATKKGGFWKSTLVWTSDAVVDYAFMQPEMLAVGNNGEHFLLAASWQDAGLETTIFESFDGGTTFADGRPAGYLSVGAERMYHWNGQWVLLGSYALSVSTDGLIWETRDLSLECLYNNAYMMDSQGNIHICEDDGDGVLYSLSKDLGQTWTTPTYVIEDKGGGDWLDGWPFVTASDGHVVVGCSFEDASQKGHGLYLSFSHDGGQTWKEKEKTRHALQEEGTYTLGYFSPGTAGFVAHDGNIELCVSMEGYIDAYQDESRHWAYYCPDWRAPITDEHQSYTLTLETIGRGYDAVASSVDWETGLSAFVVSYPFVYPFYWITRHNVYADVDMRSWRTWDIIQQRTPEPVYSLFPGPGSPVHRGPFSGQCPPPQFYMQDAMRGYSFWW